MSYADFHEDKSLTCVFMDVFEKGQNTLFWRYGEKFWPKNRDNFTPNHKSLHAKEDFTQRTIHALCQKLQGYQKVFIQLKCAICAKLVHVNTNCIKYQILIGIIPTFSENFIQIDKVWPRLQPKTWSEAILRMYTSLDHFSIDSLKKLILEAAIDRLDIHFGTISPFNQHWISWQSMAAPKCIFGGCWW